MNSNRNPAEMKSEISDEEISQNIKQALQTPLTMENVSKVYNWVQQIKDPSRLPDVFKYVIESAESLEKSPKSLHKNYIMHITLIHSIYRKSGYDKEIGEKFDVFDNIHFEQLKLLKKDINLGNTRTLNSSIRYFDTLTRDAEKITDKSCRTAMQEILSNQFKDQLNAIPTSKEFHAAIHFIGTSQNEFLKKTFIKYMNEEISRSNLAPQDCMGLIRECWDADIVRSDDEKLTLWHHAWRTSLMNSIEKYINAGHRNINEARATLLLRELEDPNTSIADLKLHIFNILASKENQKLKNLLRENLEGWVNTSMNGYKHGVLYLEHDLKTTYALKLETITIDGEVTYIKQSELAEKNKRVEEWKNLTSLVAQKIKQDHLKFTLTKAASATELQQKVAGARNYKELYQAINAAIERVSNTDLSLALHQIKYSLTNFKDVSDTDLDDLAITLKRISPNIKGEYYQLDLAKLKEKYESWRGTLYLEDSTDVIDNKFFKPLEHIETIIKTLSDTKDVNVLSKFKMEVDKTNEALNTLEQAFNEIQKAVKEKEEKNWKEFVKKEKIIMSSADKTKTSLTLIRDKYYHLLDNKEKELFQQAKEHVDNMQDESNFVKSLVGLGIDKIVSRSQKIVTNITKLENELNYWENHINKLRDVLSERINDPNLSEIERTKSLAVQARLNTIYASPAKRHDKTSTLEAENLTKQPLNLPTENSDTSHENIPKIKIPASTQDKLKYLKEIYKSWDGRLYWEGSHNPLDFKDHKTLMAIEKVINESEAIVEAVKFTSKTKVMEEMGRELEKILKSKDFVGLYEKDETHKLKEKLKIEKSTIEFNESEKKFKDLQDKTLKAYANLKKVEDCLTENERKMLKDTSIMSDKLSNPDLLIGAGGYDKLSEIAKKPCEAVIALEQDVNAWRQAVSDKINKITHLRDTHPSEEVKAQMGKTVAELKGMLTRSDRDYNVLIPFAEHIDRLKANPNNSPTVVRTPSLKGAPSFSLFPPVPEHDPLQGVKNTKKVEAENIQNAENTGTQKKKILGV